MDSRTDALTGVDWSTAEAGRELDAAVHSLVMGEKPWRVERHDREGWYEVHLFAPGHERPMVYGRSLTENDDGTVASLHSCPMRYPHLPFYSTNVTSAFGVAERMSEIVVDRDTHHLNHLMLHRLGLRHGWAASFDTIIDDDEWHEHVERYPRTARAETAPLAICRAALLTVVRHDPTTHQE